MAEYLVTLEGLSREIYVVEADSPEEAEANWMFGAVYAQEAYFMEVTDVRKDD
jgi:hypothetical protein